MQDLQFGHPHWTTLSQCCAFGAIFGSGRALQPHRAGSVYVNFLDSDDGTSRVREVYGERAYRRLGEGQGRVQAVPDSAGGSDSQFAPLSRSSRRSWPELVEGIAGDA